MKFSWSDDEQMFLDVSVSGVYQCQQEEFRTVYFSTVWTRLLGTGWGLAVCW